MANRVTQVTRQAILGIEPEARITLVVRQAVVEPNANGLCTQLLRQVWVENFPNASEFLSTAFMDT